MSRLDQTMVDRGLAASREQAKRLVLAGQVWVNGHRASKGSDVSRASDEIRVEGGEKYVSRGGHKLEHGLRHFGILPSGMRALDIGASTGGFTDCLLQEGAARVWAVDVGHGQLAWKLRNDPRVEVMERVNARHLTPASFGPGEAPFDLAVADCSFISLRLILPPMDPLVRVGGKVVALVKPQFEAGKEEVDRGEGVIRDPAIHARVLRELEEFVGQGIPSLRWLGHTESPLLGPAGNREFLVVLEKIST